MARSLTIATLVERCKQRCDQENSGLVGAAEWKALASELYGELHALVTDSGARYFESAADISADGSSSYALPANHLSTIGVDRILDASTGRRIQLDELMIQERGVARSTGDAQYWCLSGPDLELYPRPTTGLYEHIYVPQPTDLSAAGDGTSVDLINIYGEKFVIWGVASLALHKGEANQMRAVEERNRAAESLQYWATQRALNNPRRRMSPDTDPSSGYGDPADWRYR